MTRWPLRRRWRVVCDMREISRTIECLRCWRQATAEAVVEELNLSAGRASVPWTHMRWRVERVP